MHSSGEINCVIRELERDLERNQARVIAFKGNNPTLLHIYYFLKKFLKVWQSIPTFPIQTYIS